VRTNPQLRGRLQSVIESSINEDTRLYPFLQKLRNDLLQTLENVQRVEDEANDDEDDEADK
jgi:hypothetical protein